jgi:hypothetical protein
VGFFSATGEGSGPATFEEVLRLAAPTPTGFAEIVCDYFPVPNRHEGESAKKREQLLVEKSFARFADWAIQYGADVDPPPQSLGELT